uniref:Uncharacterized protein n=1 Tax=Salix viminalis TaxID=40686 RepID=A0A6N2KDS9_SALVM
MTAQQGFLIFSFKTNGTHSVMEKRSWMTGEDHYPPIMAPLFFFNKNKISKVVTWDCTVRSLHMERSSIKEIFYQLSIGGIIDDRQSHIGTFSMPIYNFNQNKFLEGKSATLD